MSKVTCTHCSLTYDESMMIVDNDCLFCCKGCQGVYHLLKDEGLDSFYDKKGSTTLETPNIINNNEEYKKFDSELFKKQYIKEKDGLCEINLVIEGIHCSACVWLNEKVLHREDGILEASINFTNNKAHIVYDPDSLKLSRIFEIIESIGYKAYPYDKSKGETQANANRQDYYARLMVGVFATMNVMWLAIAQYAGYFSSIKSDMKDVLNIAEFILATPTLFYTGWVYFKGAYFGLKNRFINMDFLVITGAVLAYSYSIYVLIKGSGEVYFDSVTMIITFVFIGKYLEVLSKKKAVDTMDAMSSFLVSEVVVIVDGKRVSKAPSEVEVGDIIEIKAGEKVVLDGEIVSGSGSFDNSSLTGESEPIYKEEGSEVLSGTILLDAVIRLRVGRVFEDSMISKIVTLLEDAMNKKPHIEKLANEISGYFSVTILGSAFITFLAWFFLGFGFEKSLIVGISVVVIACPCALGLATPIATLVGISIAANKKIIFKESAFLETMAKANTLLLDKTGTITKGKPRVVSHEIFKEFDENILYSLLLAQTHPISKGVREFLEIDTPYHVEMSDIKNVEAKGITALYDGKVLLAGNRKLLQDNGIKYEKSHENSILIFCIDDEVIATYELQDEPKEGVKESIKAIKRAGLEVIMLTGDHEKSASKIAARVGIKEFHHSLTPANKAEFVKQRQESGDIVIMAGDGINDSIALGLSDIAVSMGSGAQLAVEVSDVVLLDNQMTTLRDSIILSKNTYRNIKQNLGISLTYNLITIPLAVMGYVVPVVAAFVMSLSSLFVVANSLRMKLKE